MKKNQINKVKDSTQKFIQNQNFIQSKTSKNSMKNKHLALLILSILL